MTSKKQCSPAKNWCFTLNNWKQQDVDHLKLWATADESGVTGLAFQSEIGDEKTPHLQGHVSFKNKVRAISKFAKALGHKRTHVEVRKGSIQQNQEYCLDAAKRSDDGIRFNYGFPEMLVQVKERHLRPDQLAIADLFREPESPLFGRKVYWFWEEKGAWGKSFLCKYMVDNMGAYVVSGKNSDVLSTIAKKVTVDGGGPPIVIFDVPRVNEGHVSYQAMEGIKNGLFYSGKYEGCMVRFNSPHLLVFANAPPDETKLSADRWVVRNLRGSGDSPPSWATAVSRTTFALCAPWVPGRQTQTDLEVDDPESGCDEGDQKHDSDCEEALGVLRRTQHMHIG